MSDFDEALERLLTDPAFAAALSADPDRALAGYRLAPDEVEVLRTSVSGDSGGEHRVEVRANQSSLFGLLAPLAGLAGALPGVDDRAGGTGLGQGPPSGQGFGNRPSSVEGLGGLSSVEGFGGPSSVEGLGGLSSVEGFGGPSSVEGLGGPSSVEGFGGVAEVGLGGAETGPPAELAPPDGYRTRVDVDADGRWDRHSLLGRADGGVDIVVDHDRDGRIDFVGHDLDADGLVDSSEYDQDGDGSFERRMYDDDGDGWMDRTVRSGPPRG
jgi:hypothetical protein